jgi:hypothetical protein
MYTLTGKEMQRFTDMAIEHYPTRADIYHNLPHPYEVWDRRQQLDEIAARYEIYTNPQVAQGSALWHDAGIMRNPQDFYLSVGEEELKLATCSEDVARALCAKAGRSMGLPEDFIGAVNEEIGGTNPHGDLVSVGSKQLAFADTFLIGLGDDETFDANNHKLRTEAEWKNGIEIPWDQFVAGSIGYLGLFMVRNIHVTPEYYDEQQRSLWHIGAMRNILRLANETWQEVHLAGQVVSLPTMGQDWRTEKNIRVVMTTDGQLKDGAISKPRKAVLGVPVEAEGLPVPDGIFDVLELGESVIKSPQIQLEAERALKPNGVLRGL